MKGPIGCLPRYVWAPNISGKVRLTRGDEYQWKPDNLSGAFALTDETSHTLTAGDLGYNLGDMGFIQFDASKSSNIYAGSKVQTASLQCLACIKI